VGRTLASNGVPLEVLSALQLDAARCARTLGRTLRASLDEQVSDGERVLELSHVAMQLSATAFEIAFLDAAAQSGAG